MIEIITFVAVDTRTTIRRKTPLNETEATYFEHQQIIVAINRVPYEIKIYEIFLTDVLIIRATSAQNFPEYWGAGASLLVWIEGALALAGGVPVALLPLIGP
jgi:hypothetical protein